MYQAYESEHSVARQKAQVASNSWDVMGLWLSACGSVDTNQSTGTEAKPSVVATSTVIND